MPVDVSALFTALTNFGGLGVVIAFLVYKDVRADRLRDKAEEKRLNEQRLAEERRLTYDRERLATDKDLAASLAALTSAIQTRGR